ncbi:MAG: hypothetical protein QG622_3763 [Actinomycetota bacterium]|nr:hypothetical protein [Actinomycetota bacterium]
MSPRSAATALAVPEDVRLVPGAERVVNPDPSHYMTCRQRQILAYLLAVDPWAGLLKYAALESTAEIYHHCVIRRQARWTFEPRLGADDDLEALGHPVRHLGDGALDDLPRVLEFLAAGQPVLFYAPSGDVPYFAEYLRGRGKIDTDALARHSVLLAGVSPDATRFVALDIANPELRFVPEIISWEQIVTGHAAHPGGWFLDATTIGHRPGPPDAGELMERYRRLLSESREGFEIYGQLPDVVTADRAAGTGVDTAPSLDSLRMLAGSRTLFHQFLLGTTHHPSVVHAYHRVARLLRHQVTQVAAHLTGQTEVRKPHLRRELTAIAAEESAAFRRLRADLAHGPITFHPFARPFARPSVSAPSEGRP